MLQILAKQYYNTLYGCSSSEQRGFLACWMKQRKIQRELIVMASCFRGLLKGGGYSHGKASGYRQT